VDNKAQLKAIIDDGTFDAKSLSSMLNGAGKDLAAGIDAVHSRLPKLKALCTKFKPTQIATRLHVVPPKKLGETIDKMYLTLSSELNGNTIIPPDSGVEVVEGSPATAKPERGAE
jgi:hypothetical protein